MTAGMKRHRVAVVVLMDVEAAEGFRGADDVACHMIEDAINDASLNLDSDDEFTALRLTTLRGDWDGRVITVQSAWSAMVRGMLSVEPTATAWRHLEDPS